MSSIPHAPNSWYPWADGLKALGIILVVFGHQPLTGAVHGIIYAFHMPLFFMVSGFLIKPGGWELPPAVFFKKRILRLLQYYAAFGLLCGFFYCYIFRDEQDLVQMVVGRLWSWFYGSASFNDGRDLFPLVLWYFPAFITAMMLAYLIWNMPYPWLKFALVIAIYIGGIAFQGAALPWELESGMLAALFVSAGHWIRIRANGEAMPSWLFFSLMVLAIGGLALVGSGQLAPLDMRQAIAPWSGPLIAHIAHGILTAIIAIVVVLWLAAVMNLFRMPRWVHWTSAATIWIFPLHMLIFRTLNGWQRSYPWLMNGRKPFSIFSLRPW